ncbi:uncharacterized protein LOC126457458 isoform X2 [Schistocerca serialis cubense]|uniref:uncharacterized protein LOC126457458 isoform X2 n=2 Tax=Schistocerca TaxID=7008 RepID=UPI00214EFE7A|nr:uncharacterized protein LOC126457458 isoform X2 [Schistocerca serialis cubense]
MTQWQLIRTRTEDAVVGQRRKRKPRDRGVGMRVGLADKCVRSVCSSAQHSTAETSQPAMDVKAAARTPAQAPSRSSYSMDPKVSFWRTAEGGRASICGSSSSSAYVYVDLPPATGAGDEDLKGAAPPVLSLSFAAKLFELVLTLVAEGLYAAGDALITDNFRTFIFPHVVYNTFIIVSGIVVTSYLLRIKMQELLMRVLGTMAAVMMLTAEGAVLRYCVTAWPKWSEYIEDEQSNPEQLDEEVKGAGPRRAFLAAHLAVAGLLAATHLADVAASLARTLRAL